MEQKLSRALLMMFCIALFQPQSATAQSEDRSDQFLLLPAAAPNRAVGPDDPPNVLLIIVDDLNVALGSYLDSAPYPQYASAKTPNIDRLATQGILFERAYVQNPVCSPSRASFLSGLRPSSTDIYGNATFWRDKLGDDLRLHHLSSGQIRLVNRHDVSHFEQTGFFPLQFVAALGLQEQNQHI